MFNTLDTQKLLETILQSGSFIAAFASIAAGVMMIGVTKKFSSGVLASGFRIIAIGVFFVALGIIIDGLSSFLLFEKAYPSLTTIILFGKDIILVTGTFIVVIGTKKTVDTLSSLTK